MMKFKSLYFLLCLSLFNHSHIVFADEDRNDEQDDRQEQLQQELEDKFTKAVETKNKAQILGYIKQDPSLLFSVIDSDDFVENPEKIIHILTVMKKAGVDLNYQDEDGNTILHAAVEVYIFLVVGMPAMIGLINNIGSSISRFFTREANQEENDKQDSYFSESDFIEVTQSTQKIVKGLLNLGVKKKLKDSDGYTAADHLKAYIDEKKDEFAGHLLMKELQQLYKMLK